MTNRLLRWIAVVVSIVGVIVVIFVARRAKVPTVSVADIETTMNFAYIHINGVVSKAPTVSEDSTYISFTFADSTGEISVRAYGETAKGIIAQKRIPLVGDSVSVYGTVRIVESRPSVTLNLPEKLTFAHPEAEKQSIAGLQRARKGIIVETSGQIASIKQYNTLTIVYLSDESGNTVELPISQDMFSGQSISSLKIGSIITATGMLSDYRGRVQLIPRKADDVVVGGAVMKKRTKPKILAIGDVTTELVGTRVTIEGKISAARKIRGKGIILTLKNGDDYISVPVWSDVYDKLPGKVNLKRGAVIRISGKVGEYKHKLQVTPQYPSDIIFK